VPRGFKNACEAAHIDVPRIAGIAGIAGTAKTALAEAFAHQDRSEFTSGVLWANLATNRDTGERD